MNLPHMTDMSQFLCRFRQEKDIAEFQYISTHQCELAHYQWHLSIQHYRDEIVERNMISLLWACDAKLHVATDTQALNVS